MKLYHIARGSGHVRLVDSFSVINYFDHLEILRRCCLLLCLDREWTCAHVLPGYSACIVAYIYIYIYLWLICVGEHLHIHLVNYGDLNP